MTNQETQDIIITCVKHCTTIDQLKVLRRLHAGNGPVQSAIITRTRELHQEAILKAEELYRGKSSVGWDGTPLDV